MDKKRKPISKKLRFEVFKRDNFTCQYCGKMAPDTILEIDHINPVKNNGDNNILNLITSCIDCNRGKGAKKLSENDILKKQQEQLKEINKKQEQLKLMIKWKKELDKFDDKQIKEVEEVFLKINCSLSEHSKCAINKLIKRYGFSEVYDSTIISIDQYYEKDNYESIVKCFNYIGRICVNRKYQKDNPLYAKINYISAILKNRLGYYDEFRLKPYLKNNLKEEDIDYITELAKNVRNWSDLRDNLEEYYGEQL